MDTSLSKSELKQYISRQLDYIYPDKYKFDGKDIVSSIDTALERIEYCFKHIASPHYTCDGKVWFDHLHTDQYSSFLYFLANSLWKKSENKPICDKLTALNKSLNAIFISYKCKLPDIFFLSHPLGTVLGNAEYSDFLVVLQNVTVNTSEGDSGSLKIGKGVFLSAGVSVIGNKSIGNYCSIGANTLIYKKEIPDNSIVFTDSVGKITIKQNKQNCFAQNVYNVKIQEENDEV